MNTVRLRKLLLWLAGTVGLYALVGFLAVPALVKRQAVEFVETTLAHRIELADVRFNPFTLAAEIEGFSLAESNGAKLLSFKRLFVDLQATGLFRRTWTFAALELDAPDLRFELRPEGRHSFSALLDKLRKPSPEPDAPMPRVEIARIRVSEGRLEIADLPAGNDARLALQPIAFELSHLSTLPSETSPYKLLARTAEGESIQWGGDITLNPMASRGKLALQNWKIATLDRLLGNRIGLHSASGQIDLAIDYRASFAQGQPSISLADAAMTVTELSLVAVEGAAPLVGAGKVSLTGGKFDLAQRTASVERIAVDGASVALAVAADGTPNWSALLPASRPADAKTSGEPNPEAASSTPHPPAARTAAPWQVKLGRIEASELALSYTDPRTQHPMSASLAKGRFGLAATLEAGPQGISGVISDVMLSTGALSAEQRGHKAGIRSIELALAALRLNTTSGQPRAGLEGLRVGVAGAVGNMGKQAARIDAIELAAASLDLALSSETNAPAYATIDTPALEARGLGARVDGMKEVVEAKTVIVGAKRLRMALDRVPELQGEGLRAAVDALVIRESDGRAVAAHLGKLDASGGTLSSSKRNASFERLVLSDGHASAAYGSDGRLNWDRLVAQFVPPAPAAAPVAKPTSSAASDGWNIAIKLVEAEKFSASYADARQQPALAVAIQDVAAKLRNVDTSGRMRAGVEVSGRIRDSGLFRVAGAVDPMPLAADLKLRFDGLSLLPAQPFLARYARLRLVSGLASAEGRLRYGKPKESGAQIVYEGSVGLDKLDLQESDPAQPFFALGAMRASQMRLTLAPNGLDVPDLRLDRLATKLLIAEDQSINLLKVLRDPPAAPPAGTDPPVNKPSPAPPATDADDPFPVSIGRIRIDRSELEFADLSLRPQLFSTRMHELQGVVTGVSTSRESRARLELDARVDEFGAASIRGSINPFRPRAYTEVDLDFRNIAMTNLSPYATKFAGYRIAAGQMSIDLRYRVKNNGLQGSNRIILDNLQLGERVESPTALNLPLEFAIAILKDSNGRIDIGLPVSGSLDDPQFSIAGLVWKAIGNLITNIVTAPFRALASLFGGGQNEQLGAVEFEPGSAALRPPERQKLRTVAEALQKRPQLRLTIKPTFAAAADREALKSLEMRRAVLARAGIKLESGESPGPLDVGNARMQQAIEALYTERFGLPAARDLRAGLAKAAPDPQSDTKPDPAAASGSPAARQASRVARTMSNRLLETTEVSETELTALGKRRADAISAELQSATKIEPGRLGTEAPKSSEAKGGQIVSELDLSVAK